MKSVKLTIKPEDFEAICRTCLNRNEVLTPISDTGKENDVSLSYMMNVCLSLQTKEQDFLPPNICSGCIESLTNFYMFRKKCHNSELLLKTVIENAHEEFNYDDIQDSNSGEQEVMYNDHKDNVSLENMQQLKTESDNSMENENKLKKQTKAKFNKKVNKCKVCHELFETKETLQQHSKESGHKQAKTLQCEVCQKIIQRYKLTMHMRSHTKEKPFKCPICSQGFSTQGNMQRHLMIHTGERPHICEHCGKGFIQRSTLLLHEKVHKKCRDSNQQFKCPACPRQFKRLFHYRFHLKKQHSDAGVKLNISPLDSKVGLNSEFKNQSHRCDICEKYFKTLTILRNHQKSHGEKSFLCNSCGKSFVKKAALESHVRIHTGEKPHKCEYCGKAFAYFSSYSSHILIHQGLKPHQCHICNKKFTQASHLKHHLRMHSGEKPFHCSHCGKGFSIRCNLKVHERTHTGETPYLCPVCGKGFYDSSSRRKHCRSHGLDVRAGMEPLGEHLIPQIV